MAGWLAGPMIIVPILAPSCKLKLARFSAELRIQDGAECGNMKENIKNNIIIYFKIKKNISQNVNKMDDFIKKKLVLSCSKFRA